MSTWSADGDADISATLCEAVARATEAHAPLWIRGGGTRSAFSGANNGDVLDVRAHRGVVRFEPSELFVTVRAGTPLADLEALLAEHGQMLPFEPPRYGPGSSVGGMVAHGASGPRRPFAGALRDHVLGVRLLNGNAEILRFGGEVMKNVAGYDLSRLQSGAFGLFGVLLDVSLKTVPVPASEVTLVQAATLPEALAHMTALARRPLPLSALAWRDGHLLMRLSGTAAGVAAAAAELGGERSQDDPWPALRDLPPGDGVWRLSLPPASVPPPDAADWTIDWGGALRWLRGAPGDTTASAAAQAAGGYTTWHAERAEPRRPAPSAVRDRLQQSLKVAFDPHGVFNAGVLGVGER